MLFKNLRFGKKKQEKPLANDAATTPMAELEAQLKDRTEGLKQTEKKLKELAEKVNEITETDVNFIKPHGPIGELSIEPEDALSGIDSDEANSADTKLENKPEANDLVTEEAETAPEQTAKKAAKTDLDAASLKALFTSHEEEENPLTNLINSLPDITVDELMEDIKEIKEIIRDWQRQ